MTYLQPKWAKHTLFLARSGMPPVLGNMRKEGPKLWLGFLKLKYKFSLPSFVWIWEPALVLARGSSMYGRSALLQLVAWVVATSCSWLPSGPGCWWLPCRQALDALDWYWQLQWSLKDQQSRKLLSEWSPWKWTLQENWTSLWKVCLLVLLKSLQQKES